MALDRALLDAAEKDGKIGWRVYGWDGPWLTMGMNQDPAADLLPTNPVPWVMRPTGGKAVLHGHDVTVGLAAPLVAIWTLDDSGDGVAHNRSVRAAYRWVTRPIIEALNACGLPCDLAENVAGVVKAVSGTSIPRPLPPIAARQGEGEAPNRSDLGPRTSGLLNPQSSDCFAGVSRNDIVDLRSGLKCCGCAFRMTKSAVLLQASIPAGEPLVDPALVFAEPSMIATPMWEAERFVEAFGLALS